MSKIERMRQTISLVTRFSALAVVAVGCAGLPPKPQVPICSLDLPREQVHCVLLTEQQTNSLQGLEFSDFQKVLDESPGETRYTEPLVNFDRAITFKPKDWGEIAKYQRKLRAYAEIECRK